MNNEAKVRRLTKAVVLGQGEGRVMSFEDIEAARAARAVKDAIKGKGKRGRKRKSAALEADEPEAEPEVARAAKEFTSLHHRGLLIARRSTISTLHSLASSRRPTHMCVCVCGAARSSTCIYSL
jgi:hypothetical protein